MGSYVAGNLGTLYFHRPIFDDRLAFPSALAYDVLIDGERCWIARFQKKSTAPAAGVS
jgi:hypothetical protein